MTPEEKIKKLKEQITKLTDEHEELAEAYRYVSTKREAIEAYATALEKTVLAPSPIRDDAAGYVFADSSARKDDLLKRRIQAFGGDELLQKRITAFGDPAVMRAIVNDPTKSYGARAEAAHHLYDPPWRLGDPVGNVPATPPPSV